MSDSTRRNIYMDDELHDQIKRAALREGADKGEPVSISEWVSEACRMRLEAPETP